MDNEHEGNHLYRALEQAARDPLAEEYWNNLFNPLRTFLVNRLWGCYCLYLSYEDVEEAADEIILRLYKHFEFAELKRLPEQQRRMRFHAFVKRIIQSVISEMARAKGTVEPLDDAAAYLENASVGPWVAPEPGSRTRKPATTLIRAAFEALTPGDRQILRYRVIQGLPYADIQACFNQHGIQITIDALKMRSLRALSRLRVEVQKISEAATNDFESDKPVKEEL